MRDHAQIIDEAGGDEVVAEKLAVPLNTVRAWKQRKRISHTRWAEFAGHDWASFEELAASVEPKRAAA